MKKKKSILFPLILAVVFLISASAGSFVMAENGSPDLRLAKKPVRIIFSLNGGAAPQSDPNIFLPTETSAKYSVGDTVPVSEFEFFKNVQPVLDGDVFNGWRFDIEDEEGNRLAISNAYYTFGEGILLDPGAAGYRIHFYANWQSGHIAGDKFKVPISFDLGGGSAPASEPNVFDPRETDGEYQFLDQIPPNEFAFFKDSIPVLDGSVFAGWQVVLANGSNPLGAPADYTYGPLLLAPGTADGHYSIIFKAVWSIMSPHAPVDVKISFDLKGGAEPKGYEGIFATRNMTMPYAPDSMAPESEFAFFKGIKPVREGFDFEGWRFDVYDSGANILAVSNAYYVFDAIHLPAGNYNGYEIKFEANWEKTTTAQPKPEKPGNVITGDDSKIYKWLTVGLVSAAGAVLMIVAVGRKRRSRAK